MNKFDTILLKMILIFVISLSLPIPSYSAEEEYEEEMVEEYYTPELEGGHRESWAIFELSGIATKGNSNTGSLFFSADIYHKKRNNWINFNGNSYYAEASDIEARTMEGLIRGGHDLNTKNYLFLFGALKHDLFQQLDMRSTFGLGFGYHLITVSYEELAVEMGFETQSEEYRGMTDESYTELRLATNYVFRFSETARFENKTECMASLKDKKDYRIRSEFKLVDIIYKNIGMLIKGIIEYDGFPADREVVKLDSRMFAGITFDFL